MITHYRIADAKDSDVLLKWRNEWGSRRYSQNTDKITQDDHEFWFLNRINKLIVEPIYIFSNGVSDI